jgi:transposase-like protein
MTVILILMAVLTIASLIYAIVRLKSTPTTKDIKSKVDKERYALYSHIMVDNQCPVCKASPMNKSAGKVSGIGKCITCNDCGSEFNVVGSPFYFADKVRK